MKVSALALLLAFVLISFGCSVAMPTATPTSAPSPSAAPTSTPAPTAMPDLSQFIPARGTCTHYYQITEEYDKFKDETRVVLLPAWRDPNWRRTTFLISFSYPQKNPTPPAFVGFAFAYVDKEWQLLNCHETTLLLNDAQRMPLETTHENIMKDGNAFEYLETLIPLSDFLAVVNADKVEAKVCEREWELTGTDRAAF